MRSEARPERADKHDALPGPRHPYHVNDDRRIRHFKPSVDRDFRNDRRAVYADYRRRPPVSPPRITETANREVWVPHKDHSSDSAAASDPRGSGRLSVRTARQHSASHTSHTPPPRHQREPIRTPPGTGSARTNSKDRRPALERISPVVSVNVSSERHPAMEGISLPPNREPLPLYEDVATNPAPPPPPPMKWKGIILMKCRVTGRLMIRWEPRIQSSPTRNCPLSVPLVKTDFTSPCA